MKNLQPVWRKTKKRFGKLEKELVDCYISFLREVARYYLIQGRRVFFRENNVVHWGEGNFGWLVIEGKEDTDKVFGEYISEISFEPKISREKIRSYTAITKDNIDDIKYERC